MIDTVPVWPVQKLWLLWSRCCCRRGRGPSLSLAVDPSAWGQGMSSCSFLASFCPDACLSSPSSNGNCLCCSVDLLCKGRWGYRWRNASIRLLKKTSLIKNIWVFPLKYRTLSSRNKLCTSQGMQSYQPQAVSWVSHHHMCSLILSPTHWVKNYEACRDKGYQEILH